MRTKLTVFLIVVLVVMSACAKDKAIDTNDTEQDSVLDETNEIEELEVTTDSEEEVEEKVAVDYESPDSYTVLVNKHHSLPDGYEPNDLVVPDVRFPFVEDDPKKQLRKDAAESLEQLFAEAEEAGHHLFAQSGYRSFERQDAIFAANVERDGEEAANKYSARPGESEHQTGLVMDITSEAVGFRLEVEFGDTAEGQWVANNAHRFGYIIRYDQGKEHITEYQYEPWHLRYVGHEAAEEIYEQDLTLEQYVGVVE